MPEAISNESPSSPELFRWPEGKRAALSLTFDDARISQADVGLPILDAHGAKASFYVSPKAMEQRLEQWRRAVEKGHEIGNHTLSHPCSGNYRFSRHNPLEEYTPERWEDELLGANAVIRNMLGVTPQTFAYPCGQKYVGRGETLRSTVPLVARHFIAGRGFRDESANDPAYCDLAQLMGMEADGVPMDTLKRWMEIAVEQGGWLILAAHDVGKPGYQTMTVETLEQLCRYVMDEANGIWMDTVSAIGLYVRNAREAG